MKHTPIPWEMAHAGTFKEGKFLITEYFIRKLDDDISIIADIINPQTGNPSKDNAEFILRACNNYYKLLGALKGLIDCNLHENLTGGCQAQIEDAEQTFYKATEK